MNALNCWKFKRWILAGIALVSFATGSLVTARLMHASEVNADGNRVFELLVYHTMPGKVPAVESIFRDVSKLQDKHDLKVVGFWVPDDRILRGPICSSTSWRIPAWTKRKRIGPRCLPTRSFKKC